MSWAKYFRLGCGGNKNGSTYMDPGDLIASFIEDLEHRNEYGFPEVGEYQPTQQNTRTTVTTTYKPRPKYHPASYSKRWKR